MSKIGKIFAVIFGIIMIASGLYCLFTPIDTYLVIGWVIGFDLLLDAIARFVAWNDERKANVPDTLMLVSAILSLVCGILILAYPALQLGIDAFIAYYVAIWFVIEGIILIVRSAKIHKFHKSWNTSLLGTRWYLPLILGILMIIFGVLSCMNPAIIAASMGLFIGLGIIFSGAGLITLVTSVDDSIQQ